MILPFGCGAESATHCVRIGMRSILRRLDTAENRLIRHLIVNKCASQDSALIAIKSCIVNGCLHCRVCRKMSSGGACRFSCVEPTMAQPLQRFLSSPRCRAASRCRSHPTPGRERTGAAESFEEFPVAAAGSRDGGAEGGHRRVPQRARPCADARLDKCGRGSKPTRLAA